MTESVEPAWCWCWLSFADPSRCRGEQFLGVAIVEGLGATRDDRARSAVIRAGLLGVNPGGQVGVLELPEEHVPVEGLRNRLLSRADLERVGLVQKYRR